MTTITVPTTASSTEVDETLRTTFSFSSACLVRVQVQVLEPVAGARLEIRYTLNNGVDWDLLSATGVGPWVSLGTAGYARGALFNVAAPAREVSSVVLGVFAAGADGEAVLGSLGLLVYVNTIEGASCAAVAEVGP